MDQKLSSDAAVLPALAKPSPATLYADQGLEALATGWLLGYGNRNTRAAYLRDLTAFAAWCAGRDLDPLELHRSHLELYARALEAEGKSPATVSRRLSGLAGFYRWCEEEGRVSSNPAARVRRPKVGKDSPTLGLDKSEAEALIAAAPEADRALVMLLIFNGLRVSEVVGAQAEDMGIDRGHRILEIRGKGGRIDRVPLAPRTATAIDAQLAGRQSGPMFLRPDGRPLDRHAASYRVRRLAIRAGILHKRITPHSLRHTAVTLSLDAGVPLRDVQDFARHADPRTTRRYDRGRASLDRHATYALAAYVT